MTRTLLLAAILLAVTAVAASAQDRCKVTDPTGTPLNVRTGPNGKVTGTLKNGTLVKILTTLDDGRGRPWAQVAHYQSGQRIGWLFREFVSCF